MKIIILLITLVLLTSYGKKETDSNKFKKEYQKAFVEFCFFKNDVKLMENIIKLNNFDFSLKYNVLFLSKKFN